jgi:hypothetical protein
LLDLAAWPAHAPAVATRTKRGSATLEADAELRLLAGAAEATRFFMGEGDVQHALEKLTRLLEADAIPYAILDGMALNAYGYRRVTIDVDVLLTPDGLEAFKAKHLGLGYVQRFAGSKSLKVGKRAKACAEVKEAVPKREAWRQLTAEEARPM